MSDEIKHEDVLGLMDDLKDNYNQKGQFSADTALLLRTALLEREKDDRDNQK